MTIKIKRYRVLQTNEFVDIPLGKKKYIFYTPSTWNHHEWVKFIAASGYKFPQDEAVQVIDDAMIPEGQQFHLVIEWIDNESIPF